MKSGGKKVSAFAVFKTKKHHNRSAIQPSPASFKDVQPKEKPSSASKLRDVIRGSIRRHTASATDQSKNYKKLRQKSKFLNQTVDSPLRLESVKLTGLKTKDISPNTTVHGLPPRPTDPKTKNLKEMHSMDHLKKAASPGISAVKNFLSPKPSIPVAPVEPVVQLMPLFNKVNVQNGFLSPSLKTKSKKSPKNMNSSAKQTKNKDSLTGLDENKTIRRKSLPTSLTPDDIKIIEGKSSKTPSLSAEVKILSKSSENLYGKTLFNTPNSSQPKKKSPKIGSLRTNGSTSSGKKRKTRSPAESNAKKRRRTNSFSDNTSLQESVLRPIPDTESSDEEEVGYMFDSKKEAANLFKTLIHPVKPEKFFSDLWERKPLLVKRHSPSYNSGLFSTQFLNNLLSEKEILFGVNLDVTTYENGKRETHNPTGRVYPSVLWDYYQNGCSVRFLNPQTFHNHLWRTMSVLQEYFGSVVGANMYLTPPGSQGFAPHYDDIEAFVLQLEGRKHWRLYNPRTEGEMLPRNSSTNFTQAEIGEPILDIVLEAGDLLYFPRGFIHQADTPKESHSLHVTLSTCQRNTWGDLLEKLMPGALAAAFEDDVEFRKSLPKNYMDFMGIAHSEMDVPERTQFLRQIESLVTKLLTHAPVDTACDQMAKSYMHSCLPPVLTKAESANCVMNSGESWNTKRNKASGRVEIEPDTSIKIIRNGVIRLVMESESVRIYHSLENARIYQDKEPQFIEISAEVAPAVEYLIHSYPKFVTVDDLPLETISAKMDVAQMMYEKCLLVTYEPLSPVSDIEDDDEEESV